MNESHFSVALVKSVALVQFPNWLLALLKVYLIHFDGVCSEYGTAFGSQEGSNSVFAKSHPGTLHLQQNILCGTKQAKTN